MLGICFNQPKNFVAPSHLPGKLGLCLQFASLVTGPRQRSPGGRSTARWIAAERAWRVSPEEAETFLIACQKRLEYIRLSAEITSDHEHWVDEFVMGRPFRR